MNVAADRIMDFDARDSSQGRDFKVPAVEKALDILEFVARAKDDATQTEIALGVGRSIHEVHRIIQLFEARGYLIRSKSDRYRLSLKLFELAHTYPPVERLTDVALPEMRRLAGIAEQSCHLAVLRGATVLVVLQVDSPSPLRYSVALGSHFPALETSSGAVLLAHLPDEEREQVLAQIKIQSSQSDLVKNASQRLAKIRTSGHEMRRSLVVEGCTNITAPIRNHVGATIAALTVPFLQTTFSRLSRDETLELALRAASAISRGLGAQDASERGKTPAPAQSAVGRRSSGQATLPPFGRKGKATAHNRRKSS